jgi:hypothetical protein
MLHRAWVLGARDLFKTDVSSAFNRIKLSFEAVLSQATQVDTFIVFPLVAVFGWLLFSRRGCSALGTQRRSVWAGVRFVADTAGKTRATTLAGNAGTASQCEIRR